VTIPLEINTDLKEEKIQRLSSEWFVRAEASEKWLSL